MKPLDKESLYLLQKIDCNCNDCIFMKRDIDKYNSFNSLHTNSKGEVTKSSFRVNYGNCTKFNKPVSFLPGTCQIETQECFKHRRDEAT